MTAARRVSTADDLRELVGVELGPTSWTSLTQDDINAFAVVTGDHQWVHVDTDRAATSAIGTTIAHGLLTLSIGPHLVGELLDFDVEMGFNHGYERVRFPAPLPVDAQVRLWVTIVEVSDAPGGVRVVTRQRFEREGHAKPVCVADSIAVLVVRGADSA